MILDKYLKEKEEYDKTHKVEMVKIAPSKIPMFNRSIFLQSIYDVQNMDDMQLRKFIQSNFRLILNNIFFGNAEESVVYINCFTNARFLDAFIDVIASIGYFEKDDIVKINTICYHYITINDSIKDPNIVNRMLKMASIINRIWLPRLLGLGLRNDLANILLIARFSDLDTNICVRRVDTIIINQPKELMTKDMIVSIFRIIYDTMNEYNKIFQYIMLDPLPDYSDHESSEGEWVTDDIANVDSNLSLAALDILDNLPSAIIRSTLINYAEGYRLVNNQKRVRFSMRKLSDDYYRINEAIYYLAECEGVYVP